MAAKSEDKTPLVAIYNEKPDLRKKEPPLVNLQVTNPIIYLKRWWQRIMGDEGIDFRFKIKPLTAIALTFIIASLGFGIGRFSLSTNKPYIQYSSPSPTPTPNPWRDTAFTGILKYSLLTQKYYLLTVNSEAINLDVPANIDLSKQVGKRIFATGQYNSNSNTLLVKETEDLEILPTQPSPIPTTLPTPIPTAESTPEASY